MQDSTPGHRDPDRSPPGAPAISLFPYVTEAGRSARPCPRGPGPPRRPLHPCALPTCTCARRAAPCCPCAPGRPPTLHNAPAGCQLGEAAPAGCRDTVHTEGAQPSPEARRPCWSARPCPRGPAPRRRPPHPCALPTCTCAPPQGAPYPPEQPPGSQLGQAAPAGCRDTVHTEGAQPHPREHGKAEVRRRAAAAQGRGVDGGEARGGARSSHISRAPGRVDTHACAPRLCSGPLPLRPFPPCKLRVTSELPSPRGGVDPHPDPHPVSSERPRDLCVRHLHICALGATRGPPQIAARGARAQSAEARSEDTRVPRGLAPPGRPPASVPRYLAPRFLGLDAFLLSGCLGQSRMSTCLP